ncbi:hypothetical protein P152DRAFT_421694 [Eremomyces bilateralis CBS 781.70]|uniref:Peptidase S9 prolyl oligopeptidase catalytic domain-containing protein n=1 Tax=Eremomyces bilateralis CBS 781.70 TaxID=1392243 RepID=A0A6G1FW02_9PEZI|nr:uncharacterized protein P152DRAFT_421694 [Eremomyces bilateralis CBS 781.70]KAF1810085.1 hypothetical protein P152DRAFT_421694 [Eremomyces bilateralis CBS 781.70]
MFGVSHAIVWLVLLALYQCEITGTSQWTVGPLQTITGLPSPLISDTWQILGPFQIGTREAAWGSDPLEYHGGFPSIKYNASESFKSALGLNGSVTWSETTGIWMESMDKCNSGYGQMSLSLSFPEVNWDFLQSVYGWSAKQYQAWMRGSILNEGDTSENVLLYTDQILEYAIDGTRHWGGDFYSYRRAPHIIHLRPGLHTIDIRVVRDVRAMGGTGEPSTTVRLELARPRRSLEIIKSSVLVPDVVDGVLSSPYISIPLRNAGSDWVRAESVDVAGVSTHRLDDLSSSFLLAPGQTRPFAFEIDLEGYHQSSIEVTVTYAAANTANTTTIPSTTSINIPLRHRSRHDAQKLTYPHPSGIVSYAMLRPPAANASCSKIQDFRAPILLALHGAGVDADSDQQTHSLDAVVDLCAWVLFPSGVTTWSGDDWHNWGFADVQAAVDAIPGWMARFDWIGPGVDVQSWIVSGHSNGGQGTWYILAHHPDKVLAAAPVSGYLSIPQYVPYQFWHQADPVILALVQSSLSSYRHQLLAPNSRGIPILQQHGRIDDNVPAYHARLMSQLIAEANWSSTYVELPDRNHWFDGVMTTPALQEFYRSSAALEKRAMALDMFRVVSANPGDTGPKQGIRIRRLEEPSRVGLVDVVVEQIDADTCFFELKTRNVREIGFQYYDCGIVGLRVDGKELVADISRESLEWPVVKGNDGLWMESLVWDTSTSLRSTIQMGGFDAILRTKGRFTVTYEDAITFVKAQQIARNFYQYFAADSLIAEYDSSALSSAPGNVILTSLTREPLIDIGEPSPITIRDDGLHLRRANWDERFPFEEISGAIFVSPLDNHRLALVVWGVDEAGLTSASRLVPLLTGVGSPDFVVLDKSMAWQGVAGVRAIGYFDDEWRVAERSSYV